MKKTIPILLMFAILIFALPFSGLLFTKIPQTLTSPAIFEAPETTFEQNTQTPQGESGQDQNLSTTPTTPAAEQDEFKIFNESTGQVDIVNARDYVIGSVAAEMPMTYSDEALKAQAVASYTYALALKASTLGGDPNLNGAHFSANPSQRKGYMTKEAMQSFWGDEYEQNITRLESLVDSLDGKVIIYDSAPIHACYHAISSGKTSASESVWGEALPYLISVDSPFDITSPEFNSTLRFSISDMEDALIASLISPQGDPSTWFGMPILSESGYVNSITVGGTQYTGAQIREALGLRSAAFTVAYTQDFVFEITTQGYGHGVGMSQFGANCMALTGNTHEEILSHYFPNTSFGYI